MKILLFTACFLTLLSCGKKDEGSRPDREISLLCDGNVRDNCTKPTMYIIVTKKELPKNIVVYFKNDEFRNKIIDSCNPMGNQVAFPILGVRMLGVRDRSELYIPGMSLEIIDAGEDCGNDALFFDQVVTPKYSNSWENTKVTLTFDLDEE